MADYDEPNDDYNFSPTANDIPSSNSLIPLSQNNFSAAPVIPSKAIDNNDLTRRLPPSSPPLGDFDINLNDNDLLNLDNDPLLADTENNILHGVDDLPLFANKDAKIIHYDIQKKEEKVDNLINKINDLKDRIKVMSEHYKNVQQEVDHTNQLYNSKKLEIITEKHLQQLISRELGRLKLDNKNIQNNLTNEQSQLNNLQNLIYKANEKLDEFKLQMNWNQDDLDQWAIAAKQKEEDNLILQKYTRADEIKIKELSLVIEQLNKELLNKKNILENEITDTQAKQMELDRIADEFRILHKERQNLINQWQETIEAMKLRDQEINNVGESYNIAKQERIKQENKVILQKKRLLLQINENNEIENKSELLAKLVSKKREEMVNNLNKLNEYKNELESLKNELTSAAENLIIKRNEIANKSHVIEEKRIHVERERIKYQEMKLKYEESKLLVINAENIAKEIENNLNKNEKLLQVMHNKVKLEKENLLKEIQNIHNLKNTENILRIDINGTISAKKNLDSKLNSLDKEAARQQELLYNAEFQIQQIERKISRGMGQRSDEEKKILKNLINNLENNLNNIKEKKKILMNQLRKISNELTTVKMNKEQLLSNEIQLNEKINELNLSNKMIDDEIKIKLKEKEEIMVGNDVLRLEVRRLRGLLSLKADVVYSLENRKQQLLLSLIERKEEITIHRDILKSQLKLLQEEKHTIVLDLKQRELNIEKLKSKYYIQSGEILPIHDGIGGSTSTSGGGDTSGGTSSGNVSQSYYIIKAAQKKEELRRKGDELDTNITKKEREIRALQTTLDHLNARNVAYRTSFQKVDLQGEETEILRKLEDRIKLLKEYLFKKKKELQRILTDYDEDGKRLEQIQVHKNRLIQQKEHLLSAKLIIDNEINIQNEQLLDYDEKIQKFITIHHQKISEQLGVQEEIIQQQGGTLEEKAVYSEVLKDVVQVRYIPTSSITCSDIILECSLYSWTTC